LAAGIISAAGVCTHTYQLSTGRVGGGRGTNPILLRLPLRPLPRRQTVIPEIFLTIMLEPHSKAKAKAKKENTTKPAPFSIHRTGAQRTIIERLAPTPLPRHPRAPRQLRHA
jgi:hypothetical protein